MRKKVRPLDTLNTPGLIWPSPACAIGAIVFVLTLLQMTCVLRRLDWLGTISLREITNSSLVWPAPVMPSTLPVLVLSAADKLNVPLHLHSKLRLSARPGASSSIWSLRSGA